VEVNTKTRDKKILEDQKSIRRKKKKILEEREAIRKKQKKKN
jgi:hypothetical protein